METSDQSENKKLLNLLRAGDKELLETFYDSYLEKFEPLAVFKWNCCPADAREAFQKAVISVYYKLQKNKKFSIKCSLQTFIFDVAKYKLMDIIDSNAKFTGLDGLITYELVDPETSSDQEQYEFITGFIEEVLKKLPPMKRKILDFYYFRNYDWKTISAKMHRSEKYLRAEKSRILKMLREMYPDFNLGE